MLILCEYSDSALNDIANRVVHISVVVIKRIINFHPLYDIIIIMADSFLFTILSSRRNFVNDVAVVNEKLARLLVDVVSYACPGATLKMFPIFLSIAVHNAALVKHEYRQIPRFRISALCTNQLR